MAASMAEFYQSKPAEICAEMRHSLVALESLTHSTSSDRKQLALASAQLPGSRSGHWLVYKCQFRAVMVPFCVVTSNCFFNGLNHRLVVSTFPKHVFVLRKGSRVFTSSPYSHICLLRTYYSLPGPIINYKGKSALNVNSD